MKQCQREIDSAEFAEWIAYNKINPFMLDRSEYAIAILSAMTANIHSKNNKYTYKDFLLFNEKQKETPTAIFESIKAAYNGSNK